MRQIAAVLIVSAGVCAAIPAAAEKLPPLPDGAFTYVVIPDTQRYSGEGAHVKKGQKPQSGPTGNESFRSRVEWIAANVEKERIAFVSHVGDIVDYKNERQWALASNIMARLDGKVPYGISPGNHDIEGSSTDDFNRWFPRSRYEKASWYAGGFDGYVNAKGKTVCAGNADSCQLFEAGGMKFVVLHLECNAPAPVLAWVDRMLDRYADRTAIVCTHMYLGYRTREIDKLRRSVKGDAPRPDAWFGVMDWTKNHGAEGVSPAQAWETCFSRHKNLFLVVCGDQGQAVCWRETQTGVHGNTVYSTLQDYPRDRDDSDWLRLFRFRPDKGKVEVWTYSPAQDKVCEEAAFRKGRDWHVFTLDLPGSAPTADVARLAAQPWIGDGRPEPAGAAWYGDRPAPLFRAGFVLPPGRRTATLSLAAAGYYDLSVNGRQTSATSLMPLWSPVAQTIYADAYRLDTCLRPAPETNWVTVTLGNGFYNLPPLRFWGRKERLFRDALTSGTPVFKAVVDGVPPLAWHWRETRILRNCVYLGTHLDASRPEPSVWRPAAETAGPFGRLVARTAPPVACYGTLPGVARWLKKGETQVVDFGVNGTGVPKFRIRRAVSGQRVEFLYGERLNADGSVNVLTQTAGQIKRPGMGGEGAPDVAAQRDVYVCSGTEADETFKPPFAWHVCRYVEVRGLDRLLKPGDAELLLVSSAVAEAVPGASFVSGNPDLDRLHAICRRTFRDNLMGVQSDCPGRERLGYGGDIVSTCEAYMLNWDMRAFYLKTLQDFADEAADDGWITETAPYVGIAVKGEGGRSGPISWSLAVPELIDGLLRHYNETKALDFYPVCTRYVRQLAAKHPDGLIPQCIGDHEALERAPDGVTATAHWHRFVALTAGFAKRLGRADEAAELEALAAKVKAAFAAKYVKDGVVANGTQSAQSIGLYLGLVPQDQVAAAERRLVAAIEEKGYGPTTGIFSTRYMLMYLSEHGRVDVARKIVLHTGFPGWLHMLERGATTLWETWKESDNVYSNCHPMFGSVDEWILKYGGR